MNAAEYPCTLTSAAYCGPATAVIGAQALLVQTGKARFTLDYSLLRELRLLNYHLRLDTAEGEITLSKLGLATEEFFENLWQAYTLRSQESLFVPSAPLLQAEGVYQYTDAGGESQGKAKLNLFSDCLCLLPHGRQARRIPLCFLEPPVLDGYTLSLRLDTAESYTLQRLGRDTAGFTERLRACREAAVRGYQAALAELPSRLGEAAPRAQQLQSICGELVFGLFSPQSPDFWFAGCKANLAAVELISGESTATYCYRMDCPTPQFTMRLRHAMEAMDLHRELIYCEPAMLEQKPLYRMAQERNPHLNYLRAQLCGRLIHNARWEQALRELFGV